MKQAVILAGGQGTRLSTHSNGSPKCLIDVCGAPLLDRQLLLIKKHGFTDVLILVQHRARDVIAFCDARYNWGLNLRCIDEGCPLGTAGATLAALEHLADHFLLVYGDTLLQVDLARMWAHHEATPDIAATIFVHPNDHPQDSDLVEVGTDGLITAFHPRKRSSSYWYPNLVNAALCCMAKHSLLPWRFDAGPLDFGKDIFPRMLKQGMRLKGYLSSEYVKDVGTPERLEQACADFNSGKLTACSRDASPSILFIDRDGTINREVHHLNKVSQLELLDGVASAIRRINQSHFRCCVVANQPVVARGELSFDELKNIHNGMETLLGQEGAFVDRIYFCPHHPDAGFEGERVALKIDCDCRKPRTGMVELGLLEFNGDRHRSWLIGDTTTDIETARRAGLKSVLVETGYAGLDFRHWSVPNATVPDLKAAVTFIIEQYPAMLATCKQLTAQVRPGDIILIGGRSRVGKSTFAGLISDALHDRGQPSIVVALDRWLRGGKQINNASLLDRYHTDEILRVAEQLTNPTGPPRTLAIPGYHRLKQIAIQAVDSLTATNSDVIVLEGSVALALELSIKRGVHRFHVEIDELLREPRVMRDLTSRGYSQSGAQDEYLADLARSLAESDLYARDSTRVSLTSIFQ